MNRWKLGVAALAISTAMSGGAWAQDLSQAHQTPQASLMQAQWRYQDHDRDDDRDQNRKHEDRDRHDRHDNGRWHNDRDRDRNNGSYGRRGDGDRDDVYRNGSNRGYPVYGNNGRYGVNGRGRYNNSAAQFGFQDGFRYGQNDAARGKGYNATGSQAYEDADRGYNSSFGDRNSYRQAYRQAYQQGYNQGYNGSTYGRRY